MSDQLSAPNLYLRGLICKQKGNKDEAKRFLIQALSKMPLLWSAWLEYGNLLKDEPQFTMQDFPNHWVRNFMLSNILLEKKASDSFDLAKKLLETFPNNVQLLNSIAHATFQTHDFDEAINIFQKLLSIDPYRYENLDLYSNILYIKEKYCELSALAFNLFEYNRFRPETCCVIGNYYSLRGDHQKSALYFMRAIKLDRHFISAWTLMGHEYLEMKNNSAAIESYRTAVDTDPKDFRAWYGLGQAYDLNGMHNYAAYYFQIAARTQ